MTACAAITIAGHPVLALFVGAAAGALAGFFTALLQTKLEVEPILSGILVAAEKVMEITGQIVARDKITTLMITHDMDYALSMGSRTIMLDSGKIVLDLSGPERQAMTAGALAERFYTRSTKR